MGVLQINTLGSSFAIQAQEDTQYLENLLSYFNKITEQVKSTADLHDPLKCSILAGLMLCDELYREKKKANDLPKADQPSPVSSEELAEAERITLKMISAIDNVL